MTGPGLRALPTAALGGPARPGTSRRRPEARAGAVGPWAVRPSRRFLGRLRGAGGGRPRGRASPGTPGRGPAEPARATGIRGCLMGDTGATLGSLGGDGALRAAGEATSAPRQFGVGASRWRAHGGCFPGKLGHLHRPRQGVRSGSRPRWWRPGSAQICFRGLAGSRAQCWVGTSRCLRSPGGGGGGLCCGMSSVGRLLRWGAWDGVQSRRCFF